MLLFEEIDVLGWKSREEVPSTWVSDSGFVEFITLIVCIKIDGLSWKACISLRCDCRRIHVVIREHSMHIRCIIYSNHIRCSRDQWSL